MAEGEQEYLVGQLAFVDETTLYTCGGNGLHRWNIETGDREEIATGVPEDSIYGLRMYVSADRQNMFVRRADRYFLRNLKTGKVLNLTKPNLMKPVGRSGRAGYIKTGPKAEIWAGFYDDGSIWVGRIGGSDVHVLAGHDGHLMYLAISPDHKWIASTGQDNTLRLWPMPDLDKPPLHTLPHDELIARLKTLTNLRVVRDKEAATGWKLELGPFPGWETVPEWW